MTRLMKGTLAMLVPATLATLVWGVPGAAPDLGLQDGLALQYVTLSCSNGIDLPLALDTAELMELTSAVDAVNLYPAGDPPLTCLLLVSDPSTPGSKKHDFAVGGGRVNGCFNFSFSFHVQNGSMTEGVQGTVNSTVPKECFGDTSHLTTKVNCVFFGGAGPGSAQATGVVTKATGIFHQLLENNIRDIRWDVFDSGLKGPAPKGDLIQSQFNIPQCFFVGFQPAPSQVDRGEIKVHDAP
jgi:hypothetical protein